VMWLCLVWLERRWRFVDRDLRGVYLCVGDEEVG
jgi:hypothetical protein